VNREEFFDLSAKNWWDAGIKVKNMTGEPLMSADVEPVNPHFEFFCETFDLNIPEQNAAYCKLLSAIANEEYHFGSEHQAWVSKTFRRNGTLVTEVHFVVVVRYYSATKIIKAVRY